MIHRTGRNRVHKSGDNCPSCASSDRPNGGVLIERKSSFGYFLGCSRFPKCQYTTNLYRNQMTKQRKLEIDQRIHLKGFHKKVSVDI